MATKIKIISYILVFSIIISGCSKKSRVEYLQKNYDYLKSIGVEHDKLSSKFVNENVLTFINKNLTESLYMFSSPIYIQKNNSTFDICDNSIQAIENTDNKEYSYSNKLNDIKAYMPYTLSETNNMSLEYKHTKMIIFPHTSKSLKCKKISYTNIFRQPPKTPFR